MSLVTSGAESDKLFPFSGTNPIILFILSLIFALIFSKKKTLKFTFIYEKKFVKHVLVVSRDQQS